MATRFHHPGPITLERATLTGEEAKHLARVCRLGPGDSVDLFDGRGTSFRAEVVEVGKDRVELRVLDGPRLEPPPPLELTLVTAVPKGERFDWLVEKATELGVTRLVPLRTERSVVDPRPSKLDRLRRLVLEACKQSGRSRVMELLEPMAWRDWIEKDRSPIRLLAQPGADPLTPEPFGKLGDDRRATVAIGPEGGFQDNERQEAQAAGWQDVGLGPTILRIETAAIAASAVLLTLWGTQSRGE